MPFTKNEWIFGNAKAYRIFRALPDKDKMTFNFDVTRIKWKMFVMNHAYGIKRFILKEEAELPSVGYSDVVTVSLKYDLIFFFSSCPINMEKIMYLG